MILTYEQVVEKIKEPDKNLQSELKKAYNHDQRCSMHTEPEEERTNISYLKTFEDWVEKLLSKDKYEVFKHLLTTPLSTVETTNGVLDELKKVFETQDRFVRNEFSNPNLVDDFNLYREKIGELNYWNTKGFQAMKSCINSFVIIDLPTEQKSAFPEPYFYLLSPDSVHDTRLRLDGNLEYIIFRSGGFFYAFDDTTFRKIEVEDPHRLLAEVKHGLGYTPASTFWETGYNKNSYIQKQSPVTNSLGKLDWLLYSMTSKDHLSLYAGFPVSIGYEEKCNYKDEAGNECFDGYITFIDNQNNSQNKTCPSCSAKKNLFGPGTVLFAPAPASKEDPDLIDGFKFVTPEVESLKWMSMDVDSQVSWITYNIIGVPDEVTSMAINEKQVVSQFESRVNVLNNVRDNFQRIQKFVNDTIAKLRYGPLFKGSTIKYGDRYFLHSVDEMKTNYDESKKAGGAMYDLSSQRLAIIEAQGKNNQLLKQRLLILSYLEPYPDLSTKELVEIASTAPLSKRLLQLKINFSSYISRFEREYGDVVSYLQFIPLKTKLEIINEKIFEYIAQEREEIDADKKLDMEMNQPTLPPDES